MSAVPKLLSPVLVIVTLLAGTWFWGAVVAPGYFSAIALVVAWFVLCSVIFGRLGKARPELRWWLRGTFLACSAISLGLFYWTSVRDTVVDEKLPVAVPASQLDAPAADEPDPLAPQPEADKERKPAAKRKPAANVIARAGDVLPASHSASGTARVIELAAGGRRLTLSDGFEIDPGPQVRVYLATNASGSTYKNLGDLKGSRGNQQYEIPNDVDLDTYDTVVFWCVPFTTSLASAALRPA